MYNVVDARRICYYAGPSFWVCDDTAENRRTLRNSNISFVANTFIAADGTRCFRLEF